MTFARPITNRADRLSIIALIFACILGLYLRWWNLGGPSLWFDEGYTAWLAGESPADIIRIVKVDTAPPLYYLLLHGWMKLFGVSELALRSFSCVCATLTMAIVYLTCRKAKFTLAQTSITMAILAMSVLQVRYARDARCYALVSLFAAMQLYCLISFRNSRAILAGIGVILASALMLYTHPMTLLYVAAILGGWALFGEGTFRRRFCESLIAGVAILLLFAPWLGAMLSQVRTVDGKFWIPKPGLHELTRTLQVIIGMREDFAGNAVQKVSHWLDDLSLLAVGVFILLIAWKARKSPLLRTMGIYAFAPLIVVFAYSLIRTPLMIDRIFIPSSIAIALLAGVLVEQIRWLPLKSVLPLIVVLAGVSSVGYVGYEQKEDWRSAIKFIDSTQMSHPRTLVFLANEGELLYRYYAKASQKSQVTGLPNRFFDNNPPRAMQRVKTAQDLIPLHKVIDDPRSDELVLVVSHGSRDQNKQAITLLTQTCKLMDKREFNNVTVYRFATDEDMVVRGE